MINKLLKQTFAFLLILAMIFGMLTSCFNSAFGENGEPGTKGEKGDQGNPGANGEDGKDGLDGITPQLRINDVTNEWEVSYDSGKSWTSLGVTATEKGEMGNPGANGEDGKDGLDGITPQLRINDATNEWEVSYDSGESWTSLGVTVTANDASGNIAKERARIAYVRYLIANNANAPEHMLYDNSDSWIALNYGVVEGSYASKDDALAALVAEESNEYTVLQTKIAGLHSVCRKDKVVDLVIFMGQSNMSGRGVASEAPSVPIGHGYEFRAISDPTKLYSVSEPFGLNENNPDGVTENTSKTGSMVSALMNSYYNERGIPIVGVSCSRGGTNIEYWAPEDAAFNDAINRYKAAEEWLIENGYVIAEKFMVWCQGEQDGDEGDTAEEYTQKLEAIINEMTNEAGIGFCAVVRIGNRTDNHTKYDTIIGAQTNYCKSSNKAILASALAADFINNGMMKSDGVHYTQAGYNALGIDAGKNIANYIKTGTEPTFYDPEYGNTYPTDSIPSEEPVSELEFLFNQANENGIALSNIGTLSNGALTVTADSNASNGIALMQPIHISPDESFTFEFVVDYQNPGNANPGIIISSGSTSGQFVFLNGFQFRLRFADNNNQTESTNLTKGDKMHFAMVYNADTQSLKFYQNGTELMTTVLGDMSEQTFRYFLGGYGGNYKFVGTIYYFHYVDKALGTDEFHAE